MIRTLILGFAIVATALTMASCTNTVQGVGKDLEKAGQEVQRTVN